MTASDDFEKSIQNRTVNVLTTLQLSALLFQTEYAPDQFAKKMNAPGNSSQLVDKQKIGAASWKYSCNTLTGGYIYCTVTNQSTQGDGKMKIKEYFDAHTDQRMLLKYAVIFGASLAVVYLTFALSSNLVSPEFVTLVPIAIAFLNEKVKPLDPNKPWMLIGAGKK